MTTLDIKVVQQDELALINFVLNKCDLYIGTNSQVATYEDLLGQDYLRRWVPKPLCILVGRKPESMKILKSGSVKHIAVIAEEDKKILFWLALAQPVPVFSKNIGDYYEFDFSPLEYVR